MFRSRSPAPTPPEKGSFPLDHLGECKQVMHRYLKCIHENSRVARNCTEISKEYLNCRMDKELMEKEDLSKLGFKNESASESVSNKLD